LRAEKKSAMFRGGRGGAADGVKTENPGGENERRSATDIDCTGDVCGVHASTRRLSSVGRRRSGGGIRKSGRQRSVALRRR